MIWINFEKADIVQVHDSGTTAGEVVSVTFDGERFTTTDPNAIETAKKWIEEKNNPRQNAVFCDASKQARYEEWLRNQTAGEVAG